jgi:hypothetical protein
MPVRNTTISASAATQVTVPTTLLATTAFKENSRVQAAVSQLGGNAQMGGASQSVFLPASGADVDRFSFNYGTGQPKQMNFNKPPKDGVVRGTMVVSVSGHDGRQDQYAKSNTYSVRVTLPNGKTITQNRIPRNDPSKAEYATAIPLEFPYMAGKTIIEAWPDGSAGPGGYIEGRKYIMHSHDSKDRFDPIAHNQQHGGPTTGNAVSRRAFGDDV